MAQDRERSRLEFLLPGLEGQDYQITSPVNEHYNCVAWALGDSSRRWDPYESQDAYWPDGVPRDDTLATFIALFELLGFERCDDDALEPDSEKIAIFAEDGYFTHVARQLPSGRWTSKLGNDVDIEHDLDDLVRRETPFPQYRYGAVAALLRRPRRG